MTSSASRRVSVASSFPLKLAGCSFVVALGLWPSLASAQSAGAGMGGAPNGGAGNGGVSSGGAGMNGGAG
ncbi:MAG TPA: hypothetical protein VNN72_19710, partial [Polyangiaceae bacterium]|nr:hypothetical protein [Polyangiaceae bacterium]